MLLYAGPAKGDELDGYAPSFVHDQGEALFEALMHFQQNNTAAQRYLFFWGLCLV
jgi:hypothetical protein